ncbi:MAG: DUF5006 domain-containing protein, partial [Bacteroidales bacterium]
PHPNSGGLLPAGKWKFHRAYEFHNISALFSTANFTISPNDPNYKNDRYPLGFANQDTKAVETGGAVDNARYLWVTDEGYLRMVCLEEDARNSAPGNGHNGVLKRFGTSALYSNKFQPNNHASSTNAFNNVRIYPGMRIEIRARVRATIGTGLLPGIWLQGNAAINTGSEWQHWPDYGEIDIMENFSTAPSATRRATIDQTFHLGTVLGKDENRYSPTIEVVELVNTIDQFHIYWIEWLDEETVRMGVNGAQTIELTKASVLSNGALWPFDVTVNPDGLHFLLTMMFVGGKEPVSNPDMKTTYTQARKELSTNPDLKIPRMEIDWIRFYKDNTYDKYADGKAFNGGVRY